MPLINLQLRKLFYIQILCDCDLYCNTVAAAVAAHDYQGDNKNSNLLSALPTIDAITIAFGWLVGCLAAWLHDMKIQKLSSTTHSRRYRLALLFA